MEEWRKERMEDGRMEEIICKRLGKGEVKGEEGRWS